MTLDEIAAFVTAVVGQTDSTSVALCKDFIKRRYQLIYDAHPWRDAQITATITLTGGANSPLMPAAMDRVIAIRANNRFLDPVDATFLVQTDPSIFERTGFPTVYEEWTDSAAADAKKIRVYPTPTVNTPLFIVGRRIRPELVTGSGAGSSPILRNIDNALIAYATHDMLRRQRQYAKAAKALEEASSLLEAAKALETQQSNRPRRAKGLTVSGNSLAELADAVCARCGAWSPEDLILAKEFLRRNYAAIWDMRLWRESTVIASVGSDGVHLVLPYFMDRVISVRANPSLGELMPVDTLVLFSVAPQIFEEITGTQVAFSTLSPVGVKVLPPITEAFSIFSDNTADKGNVFLRGEGFGVEVTETVALDGTNAVLSQKSYDIPLTISKFATVGKITIRGATSGIELQTLLPAETERKHIRLWLHPGNSTGSVCLVLGKRSITPLVADEDTPLLRDIQGPLIDMSVADMFSKAGNAAATTEARTKAAAALAVLVELETKQGASAPRVIPYVEPMFGYSENWLVAKG